MLLVKGEPTMANKIMPFAKIQKPEEKAQFEVTNRKDRRRRNSNKKTAKGGFRLDKEQNKKPC